MDEVELDEVQGMLTAADQGAGADNRRAVTAEEACVESMGKAEGVEEDETSTNTCASLGMISGASEAPQRKRMLLSTRGRRTGERSKDAEDGKVLRTAKRRGGVQEEEG